MKSAIIKINKTCSCGLVIAMIDTNSSYYKGWNEIQGHHFNCVGCDSTLVWGGMNREDLIKFLRSRQQKIQFKK